MSTAVYGYTTRGQQVTFKEVVEHKLHQKRTQLHSYCNRAGFYSIYDFQNIMFSDIGSWWMKNK